MGEFDDLSGPLMDTFKKRPLTDYYGFSTPAQVPWFDVRVVYLRVSSCPSAEFPEHLIMRLPRRNISTALELNGARISPSEEAALTLRRDRVDADFAEVTYVSTEKFRTSGTVSFEVCHLEASLLGGTLERSNSPTPMNSLDSNSFDSVASLSTATDLVWNMDCSCAVGSQGCVFVKGRNDLLTGLSPSSVEVCVVGRYSGSPVILTQTVQLTARRRVLRRGTLDVIPEVDESERCRSQTDHSMVDWTQPIKSAPEYHNGFPPEVPIKAEEFYPGEGDDGGEISWFNAGVRVGVGVGLGMCLGVGIGVGLMVRTYQATTKSLRRVF